MGTGIIYAAIVAVWVAVLVPMWLRRHDEMTETRSVDRFSQAMHTLSRRDGPAGDRQYVVVPPRPSEATVALTSASRASSRGEPDTTLPRRGSAEPPVSSTEAVRPGAARPARQRLVPAGHDRRRPVRDPGPAASHRRRRMLARRRRVLGALLAGTALAGGLAAAGVISAWAPAVIGALLLGDLVALWASGPRRRASRGGSAGGSTAMPTAQPASPQEGEHPGGRSSLEPDPSLTAWLAHDDPAPTAPLPRVPTEGVDTGAVTGQDRDSDEGGWQPVPVPLPTYVSKPRAPRTTRTIDFSSPETWQPAGTGGGDADHRPTGHRPGASLSGTARPSGPAESSQAEVPAAGTVTSPQPGPRLGGEDALDRILERRRAVGG